MIELRIQYASREFSFKNQAIDVLDIADIVSRTSTGRSASFNELLFPVDVASLIAAGHDFSSATGAIYVDDVVIMKGIVSEPTYGAFGEPVSLTISDNPYNDSGLVPSLFIEDPPAGTTLPGDTGSAIPIVFGRPALWIDNNGVVQSRSGSPALVTERNFITNQVDTLVIAAHPIDVVTIAGIIDSSTSRERFPIHIGENGRVLVDISGASVIDRALGEYYVDYAEYTGTYFEGQDGRAGELIAYLLERSTLLIDWDRFEAARLELNSYLLAGYFDSATSPWDLIRDHFNPILPIAWLSGIEGIYPVVYDLTGATEGKITNETRISPVTYEGDAGEIVNKVIFKHTRNCFTDSYRQQTTVKDTQSIARYGVKTTTIKCDICSDRTTAYRIALGLLEAKAWVHRDVTYRMKDPPSVGVLISLTDDELSITNARAIVRSVQYDGTNESEVNILIITTGDI